MDDLDEESILREIDKLGVLLNSRDANKRADAFRTLVKFDNHEVIKVLLKALRFRNAYDNIGGEAAFWLRLLANTAAIEPLIAILESDEDVQTRANAANALGGFDNERAVEALLRALESPDEIIRINSAVSLSDLGSKQAVEPLLKLVNSSEVERNNFIGILGYFRDKRIFDLLVETMDNYEDDTYFSIIENLGRVGDERAFPLLMSWLKDQNHNTCIAAAKGLGWLGDERALPALEWAREYDTCKDEMVTMKEIADRSIKTIRKQQYLKNKSQERR